MTSNLLDVDEIIDVGTLDAYKLWETHQRGGRVFRAHSVRGTPSFYPLYRNNDLYSYSPYWLILRKGSLNIDPNVQAYLERTPGDISPPDKFIDRDIERLGAAPVFRPEISKRLAFCEAIAAAMQADVNAIEAKNPGKTNVILCGGKDSLNLLLLKWRNPVSVYSAQPNFPLVRQFVTDNNLDLTVSELLDEANSDLQAREIAEACCMVDLANWRWTSHLRRIAADLKGEAIFWKGQIADSLLTDYWRSYTSSYSKPYRFARKAYKRAARLLPGFFTILPDRLVMADVAQSLWARGAVGQGAHMGMLRSVTDCLVLSAYHGPLTAGVMLRGDYHALTGADLRLEIGRVLAGRDVLYPMSNPAPSSAMERHQLRGLDTLIATYRSLGVEPCS
jgi:hypothetical protein